MAYRNSLTGLMGLVALAGTAQAQEMAPPAPAEAANPTPAAEKKQCRSEAVTGSMMPHRTCRTRAEWQAVDNASGQASLDGLGRMRQATGLMTTR